MAQNLKFSEVDLHICNVELHEVKKLQKPTRMYWNETLAKAQKLLKQPDIIFI